MIKAGPLNMILVIVGLYSIFPSWVVGADSIDLHPAIELKLDHPANQMRAVPVTLDAATGREAILLVYAEDSEVDPYIRMFFFPTSRLKLLLFDSTGRILWKKELGRGVIPGIWFCPVFPFDLNGDGRDEIYFTDNPDGDHPFDIYHYRLSRLDALTGEPTGDWQWPVPDTDQSLSRVFRNFIVGGRGADGQRVLITAQGTYTSMQLQGWNSNMSSRWEYKIAEDAPGARGSHMCPIIDIDNNGVDELFWGERLIELDQGTEVFCADRESWHGHSDVIQPVLDRKTGRWFLFTCRENLETAPRVAFFDDKGNRLWGDLDAGHIDVGWVARLGPGGEQIAMAIRIGSKTAGPGGFSRSGIEEFSYALPSGKPFPLPVSTYGTRPIDIDGDGIHELTSQSEKGCRIIDRSGRQLGAPGGDVVITGKLFGLPGEQIVCRYPDGTVRIWTNRNAIDNADALFRYKHPFYRANRKLTASGYNVVNLGGL